MTEDEAREWLKARFPERLPLIERFVAILREEAGRQSLIARSTLDAIWGRHVVDSAQLVTLAGADGVWLDVGSGGGLPGLVVATFRDAPMVLVEPRRKRADFLVEAAEAIGVGNITVLATKVQSVAVRASVISARAVAPIHEIFTWTQHNVSRGTQYLLPRGQSWKPELAITDRAWHGVFHVEQSLTDPASGIIVAHDVRPR